MSDIEDKKPIEGEVIDTKADEAKKAPASVLTDEDKRELNLAVLTEKTDVMNPVAYAQMKKMAGEFWQSGALNDSFDNVEQVIMALSAGREMGMGFTESINGLYFVKGKLNIYGKATPSALRRHGWRIKYKDETSESCTAVVTNVKTGEEIEDTFTFEEAKQSGFVNDNSNRIKIGWREGANRRRKLRYGALSLIIHTYLPDVIGGAAGIAEYSQDYIESSSSTAAAKVDSEKSVVNASIQKALEKARDLENADS